MAVSREQIEDTNKWNVKILYPSFTEWKEELKKVLESEKDPHWPSLLSLKKSIDDASQLKILLNKYFQIKRKLEKLYTYAHLRFDEDLGVDEHKKFFGIITNLYLQFEKESSWINPQILQIPENFLEKYLKEKSLEEYTFYLEIVDKLRPHFLSEKEEELLALNSIASQTPYKAFGAMNDADFKFDSIENKKGEKVELTNSLYQKYLREEDRFLRKNAFETLHTQYLKYENTLCELLQGQIQVHECVRVSKKYDSCLDAALFHNNIDTKVYHNLVSAVRDSLPVLHEYVDLRKKILKLDSLHIYDLYVPLVEEVEFEFSYEEACELVIESVAPLGEEYQNILKKGLLEDKWVDPFENKRKRSGAYSSGCYDSVPYILMNFHGTLNDVLTLAHEAGHSMHSYLSRKNQKYHEASYPIFVAEVASTFNEQLLLNLLLKKYQDPRKKAYFLNYKIEGIRTTFFRQAMFAEFELNLHKWVEEKIPLTPEFLKNKYLKLNEEYFGKNISIDDPISIEWARIPHFYYNFYVYQYATGISAAYALADKVLSSKEDRDKYLQFLSAGGSKYPLDLLKIAGIDLLEKTPFHSILNEFRKLLQEMKKLVRTEEDSAVF